MKKHSILINSIKKENLGLKLLSKMLLILLLITGQYSTSQTVHINPATNGGFESGSTFAANGWTATTGSSTQNQWVCSTGATAGFSGTRCAYITNNTGATPPPHNYTINATRRTHLYRDVTIPSENTIIELSFNWIGRGQTSNDMLRVWLTPTSYNPSYGTAITSTGSAPSGRILLGDFENQASWTYETITLPTTYGGQTFRLVFEWVNNASSGTQPPAAIDNISLTSELGPSNDDCANAINLVINPDTNCSTTTTGTTVGGTQSQTGCNGTADDDVWYSFVATSTFHFVTVSAGTMLNPVLQVFRGNCGSLTSVICRNANSNNNDEVATLTGLTVGDTYFVRVHSQANGTGQGTFSICVTTIPNPPNDNCSDAISLNVNPDTNCSTTTTGTTVGGTQSQTGCSGTADDDVWYSFVATSTFHFVTVSADTMLNPVLQVFRGNCGSLTSVVCRNVNGNNDDEVATLTGLTVGDTYFVRVHSQASGTGQGTFSICVTTIPNPPNDNCSDAISLTVNTDTNCSTTTTGTTVGGTQSLTGCNGTADDDVWYSFVATSTFHFVTVSAGTMLNPVLQVYSGTCGSLTSVVCRNANSNNNDEVATLTGLTVGNTYFVRVYSQASGSGQGTFSICVTTIANPNNDDCANAINVPVNSDENCLTSTNGNSTGGTQSLSGCSGTADDDVWFSFVASSTYHLITVTPNGMSDVVFQAYSGNCGSLTSLLCRNSTNGNNPESGYIYNLTIGNTYFVRVYSNANASGQGAFNICITTPGLVTASTNLHTVPQLVRDVMFENSCVNISNITWRTGTNYSDVNGIGYFQKNSSDFPFDNGVLLSTGNALFANGPIEESRNSSGGNGWLGDANVQTLMSAVSGSPQTSYNASVLEFDFTPFQDTISFDFIFASNEYGEYQCDYSDTFVFLLTNISTGVTTNIAVIPSTTTPISVVTIRNNLFNNGCGSVNASLFGNYYFNNPNLAPVNFRGTTIPLTAIGSVIPGQQYHIKLAIADRADALYDSAVFIKGNSFSIGSISMGDDLLTQNNTAICFGETEVLDTALDPNAFNFEWYRNNVLISGATQASYTVSQMGTYTVKVALKNNADCFNEASVIVEIFPQIIPQAPPHLRQCDFVSTFDLTSNSAILLSNYPAPTYTVTYFTTLADANNNTNPITNPTNYGGISNPQTIYSRVYNTVKDCYGIRTFQLRRPKTWNGSTNTNWHTAANWTPNGVPTSEDCIIVYPSSNNPIISGYNYNGYGYNLEVRNNAILRIAEDNSLTITDRIIVEPNAGFEIENNANLVQINDIVNIGNITYKRNAFIRKLDYVYWSSPVSSFHVSAVSPGTPASLRYFWNTTITNTNGGLGTWSAANENMIPGKGYIIRGPNNFDTTIQQFTANFMGVPNNGNISIPIARGSYTGADYAGTNGVTITNMDDNFNLIGNPYPSAIRYTDFMAANPNLEGSIRVWTHGTLPTNSTPNPFYSSFAYNYTSADYIIHNGTGTLSGPDTYDGFIPAGQSFFVIMNDGAATTSTANFTNSMRVRNNNAQFYRHSNQTQSENEHNRIWLDLVAQNGTMSRTLIGYVEGATYEKDRMYDAYTKAGNAMILYSLIENEKTSIQGRPMPFDSNDVVPLGFKVNNDGIYTIAIAAVDGLFSNEQTVYLRDNVLNTVHDLSANPYSFTANTGVYNERFELLYQDETLGVDQIESFAIKVITNDKIVVRSGNEQIKEIQVFDMLGRKVNQYQSVNANEFALNEQKSNQTLLLKIITEYDNVTIKKILF